MPIVSSCIPGSVSEVDSLGYLTLTRIRVNIANAAVFDMKGELGLVGNEYNIALVILLVRSFCYTLPLLTSHKALSPISSSRSPEISCSKSSDRTFGVSYDSSLGGSSFYPHSPCLYSIRLHAPVWSFYDRARHREGLFRAPGNALHAGTVRKQCLLGLFLSHFHVSPRMDTTRNPEPD